MKVEMMGKKILIIGCPGSGKSYLGKRLADKTKIPCFHIDNLYWNNDKTHVERDELIKKYQDIFCLDEFILEGNYQGTLEYRVKYADTIIYLDLPLEDCIEGIKKRTNKERFDIPWIQTEVDADNLIDWIKEFDVREKPVIIDIMNNFKGEVITLHNKEEVNEYLKRGIV